MADLDYNIHGEQVLSLTKADCDVLLDPLLRLRDDAERKKEHYEDVCADGFGTATQDTLRQKWDDIHRAYCVITEKMKYLLNK